MPSAVTPRKNLPRERTSLRACATLVAFFPSHIWKEDYLLFPLAGKVLTPEDQRELMEKFETVERELGLDVHERFEKVAAELDRRVSGVDSLLKEG